MNTAEIMKIQLWDATDVARFLNVSLSWVRQRVSAKQIPFVRVGGWMVRFRPDEIRAFATATADGKVFSLKAHDRG
jgi:excisionase family DNA binding protein